MNQTKIEWVKGPDGTQGYTWNPLSGCLNHTPGGLCLGGMFPCYAFKLANGRLKQRYLANANISLEGEYTDHHPDFLSRLKDPFYPRFWADKLDDLVIHPKKRKGIFVCDMGELFGDWIPREWQDRIFSVIRAHPQHRFYLLTKQPQNLPKFRFPENCWVGVTATSREAFTWACYYLADVEAKVKYISFEPLLTQIILDPEFDIGDIHGKGINWVIIGSMTGNLEDIKKMLMEYPQLTLMPWGKRWTLQPKIEWVEEIVKAADKAGIPVFFKYNLKPLFKMVGSLGFFEGGIYKYWYSGFLRQEVPNG